MSFESKYKELEEELSEKKFEDIDKNVNSDRDFIFKQLISHKEEIRSGKKYHKKKSKDYFYRLKLFFWKLIKN